LTAQLLDGNAFLESVKRDLAERVKRLGDRGVTPGLGTILVGDDESSAVYVRLKHENSGEIGIASFGRELPATTTQEELFAVIREYNENPEIDAFLVQLPLPKHLDEEETLRAVDPARTSTGCTRSTSASWSWASTLPSRARRRASRRCSSTTACRSRGDTS
jgi:methylenetetrahydrofolate dehydrogenase (NADP+)/methenyltetrahydrofolate cyclohydrolase